jgi:adenylosuccinate lyase/3-carboxy-cis,cis-muconate cycloisomerase
MPAHPIDFLIQSHLYSTPELLEIFDEKHRFERWLRFEAALALSQAELGVIPKEAAEEISRKAQVSFIDLESVAQAYTNNRNSLIPVIEALRSICADDYGEYVHYGATTQDVLDTSQILEIKEVLSIFYQNLRKLEAILVGHVRQHKDTIMIGRTHGQQALPITFGFKASVWLAEVRRHIDRIKSLAERVLIGQLSGAVGSMAALGPDAEEVATRTMARLGIGSSELAWHSSRDNIAEIASCFAMITTTCEKIANEIFQLGKTEMGELQESPFQKAGGSSTMPHKQNPVLCQRIAVLATHARALASVIMESMRHEHERDVRCLWSEWLAMPQISIYTGTALNYMCDVLEHLNVNPEAMKKNLSINKEKVLSEWLQFRLAPVIGRKQAQKRLKEIFQAQAQQGESIEKLLAADSVISGILEPEDYEKLRHPEEYTGRIPEIIDRALARIMAARKNEPEELCS